MTTSKRPEKITLRSYNVGFGDCFLLTFRYTQFERNILVDFGTTSLPHGTPGNLMQKIALDIKQKCNQKLDAVIATHRHRDHISGFSTSKSGRGSGDIIASCKPDIVIQPWTEHPQAELDATEPPDVLREGGAALHRPYNVTMQSMQLFAKYAREVGRNIQKKYQPGVLFADQNTIDEAWRDIEAIGTTNLSNLNAIKNLNTMSYKNKYYYVYFGSQSGLEEILPGVTTHILGPPTLEQSQGETLKQRSVDPTEFWELRAHAERVVRNEKYKLFPKAKNISENDPVDILWFKEQLRYSYKEQLLEFVRSVDDAINNTSIIILFQCGTKKLLFSGDAQIENWSYALNQPSEKELLKDVTLYKVGHHGSRNATPKTLWKSFMNKKSISGTKKNLISINSTLKGHHSGVPRESLKNNLKKESTYFSTETLNKKKLCKKFTIDI